MKKRQRSKQQPECKPSRARSFILGVHDRRWQDGPPSILQKEWDTMEAYTPIYRRLQETRP